MKNQQCVRPFFILFNLFICKYLALPYHPIHFLFSLVLLFFYPDMILLVSFFHISNL